MISRNFFTYAIGRVNRLYLPPINRAKSVWDLRVEIVGHRGHPLNYLKITASKTTKRSSSYVRWSIRVVSILLRPGTLRDRGKMIHLADPKPQVSTYPPSSSMSSARIFIRRSSSLACETTSQIANIPPHQLPKLPMIPAVELKAVAGKRLWGRDYENDAAMTRRSLTMGCHPQRNKLEGKSPI